ISTPPPDFSSHAIRLVFGVINMLSAMVTPTWPTRRLQRPIRWVLCITKAKPCPSKTLVQRGVRSDIKNVSFGTCCTRRLQRKGRHRPKLRPTDPPSKTFTIILTQRCVIAKPSPGCGVTQARITATRTGAEMTARLGSIILTEAAQAHLTEAAQAKQAPRLVV